MSAEKNPITIFPSPGYESVSVSTEMLEPYKRYAARAGIPLESLIEDALRDYADVVIATYRG